MATIDPAGILLEMAYTRYDASCRDLAVTENGELVECRRDRRHNPAGVHAVHGGSGPEGLIVWGSGVGSDETNEL